MISNIQTATIEADNSLNTNRQTAVNVKSETKPTASTLIRWTGLAAMGAGIIFAAIQPIHPADVVASVTSPEWAIITSFKMAACLLFLIGFTGLYARQMKKIGWLGLVGFLLLGLSWSIQLAFVFAEAFILPLLATSARIRWAASHQRPMACSVALDQGPVQREAELADFPCRLGGARM